MKKIIGLFLVSIWMLVSCSGMNVQPTPVVIEGNGLLPELSIDDKINEAEIIVIGYIEDVLPSKWKRQNEKDIKDATPEEILEGGLFTDSIVLIDQIFKGEYREETIRVRSYIGKTEQVELINSSEPVYEKGKTYLLFLGKDTGPTSIVDPGDYISINADTAVYEIVGDKAISGYDEWILEELIAYIQKSLSNDEPSATIASVAPGNSSTTEWASDAVTVEELMLESDLVVRARVVEAPVTHVVRIEAPMVDENGGVIDTTVIKVLFSDTVFEVAKTYMGSAPSQIAVRQTGGFDLTVSSGIEEMADDPLYKLGEEYILFLVDISGDLVHAPDSELYLTVNPFGRYGMDGTSVFSYGENLQSVELPTTLSELEAQIEQAISLTPTPTSCGQPVSRPFLPNSTGNPLERGEEVSIADAQERISYSIPLPELEEVERVWIRTNPENSSDQSIAVCFKSDLLLIVHKSEKAPDWDGIISSTPELTKISVNGVPGIGTSPGFAQDYSRKYPYPGSVGWWVDGLDITLYSDTMSLEELLKIAETTNPTP